MTAPRLAMQGPEGQRVYPWPIPPDEYDVLAPGVTSVLGKWDKGNLKWWAAKVTAEHSVRMTTSGALAALVEQGEAAAVDELKRDVYVDIRDTSLIIR